MRLTTPPVSARDSEMPPAPARRFLQFGQAGERGAEGGQDLLGIGAAEDNACLGRRNAAAVGGKGREAEGDGFVLQRLGKLGAGIGQACQQVPYPDGVRRSVELQRFDIA